MWTRELAPHVYSEKQRGYRPVYEVYDEVMNFIALTEKKDNGEYRERILGREPIHYAPSEYYNIGTIIEKGWIEFWDTLSLSNQMKLLARVYLEGMVEVIDSHRKAQEDDTQSRIKNANQN